MRIPLATTLRNRTQSTDTGARLLNAVVDSKKRVVKRPSLVGSFEVATPGSGLGLFVRSTPGVPKTEELIVIASNFLTTSPVAFGATTFVLDSVFIDGSEYGTFLPPSIGNITPLTFKGKTINYFLSNNLPLFKFEVEGVLSQNAFTSINFLSQTFLSSQASFNVSAQTTWTWASHPLSGVVGPVDVVVI